MENIDLLWISADEDVLIQASLPNNQLTFHTHESSSGISEPQDALLHVIVQGLKKKKNQYHNGLYYFRHLAEAN